MKNIISRMWLTAILTLVLPGLAPDAGHAALLKVPLNFDSGVVRDCLLQQVFDR